jgi:hypothetical protein
MKPKSIIVILTLLGLTIGVAAYLSQSGSDGRSSSNHHGPSPVAPAPSTVAVEVPAHYISPPSTASLRATLPPEQFAGKAKEAYVVARAIPQTLAQMPCYCHCDRGMGHKSLHSCFEDDHASHCATCVDEALLAYRLQKEEKLSPEQIRERIIEQFGNQ